MLWKPMSQEHIDIFEIPIELGDFVTFYCTDGHQIEKTPIVGFILSPETDGVEFRFTEYDDELYGYEEYEPLNHFGHLRLTVLSARELAKIITSEARKMKDKEVNNQEFRLIETSEYAKYNVPTSDSSYKIDRYIYKPTSIASSMNDTEKTTFLELVYAPNTVYGAYSVHIKATVADGQQYINDSSVNFPGCIRTTKQGLLQLAESIRKIIQP